MGKPYNLAVLASGGGTTFEAIGESCYNPGLALHGLITPVCLVASRPGIGAIEKAKALGMKEGENIHVCNPKDYPSSDAFGEALLAIFAKHHANLYGQYGWTVLTPGNVVKSMLGLNQHPGIPEYFGGKGMRGMAVHQAVLNFCQMSGRIIETEAVAQLVAPTYDEGSVILAEKVPVLATDTVKSLQQRVLTAEYRVQIAALIKVVAYLESDRSLTLPIRRCLPELSGAEQVILARAKAMAIETYPNG